MTEFLILILSIFIYFLIVFSTAGECYQCGARSPLVYYLLKTRALCRQCKSIVDKEK